MAVELTPGGNAPLPANSVTVSVHVGKPADISAFQLYADGKTQGDLDFVFYGQTTNDDNSVRMVGDGLRTVFEIDLNRLKPTVQRIAFTVSVDGDNIASLGPANISIATDSTTLINGRVPMAERTEAALILGEIYRRNNEWKFRFIAQGFNGGLTPLAEHFGVDISHEEATPPPPAPVSTINLSKITLTKSSPTISLQKLNNSYGLIKINLNWNQKKTTSGRFFGFGRGNRGIDLDLGAFVRLRDGSKHVVQALGNTFGHYTRKPYVELQGDDRTGAISDGEWLHIHGDHWDSVDEVLIYAFIYEGVPNWNATDGVVTLHMPGQPPVETRMSDGDNNGGLCAIARLINDNGQLKVERINQFFNGHRLMDKAFNWGFSWSRGSK